MAPLIVCGPIVRRVDQQSASIFVVTRRKAAVTLKVFAPGAQLTGTRDTIELGESLHVAVVTAQMPDAGYLPWGTVCHYDLHFSWAEDGPQTGGLLDDGVLVDEVSTADHLSRLVYDDNSPLPGFRLPANDYRELRILHGSCRKPHGPGGDVFAQIDTFIADGPDEERPQLLCLTGDQIYADDVDPGLLGLLNAYNANRMGHDETDELSEHAGHLAPGKRRRLMRDVAALSSGSCSSHLLTLAEYYAMHIFSWSRDCWPIGLPEESAKTLGGFVRRLKQTRRALANISTLMLFDDHEVTDDWNLRRGWTQRVGASPLGRRIVGNALAAYSVFQHWGNDPEAFNSGAGAELLEHLDGWDGTGDRSRLEHLLRVPDGDTLDLETVSPDQMRFGYDVTGPLYRVVALDCRTRRTFFEGGVNLMGRDQLTEVMKKVGGRDFTLLLSPSPILGIEQLEWIQIQTKNRKRADWEEYDVEPWSLSKTYPYLLEQLFMRGKTLVLSGDVHFGFVALAHGVGADKSKGLVVNHTASAFKNHPGPWQRFLLSLLRGSRIERAAAVGYEGMREERHTLVTEDRNPFEFVLAFEAEMVDDASRAEGVEGKRRSAITRMNNLGEIRFTAGGRHVVMRNWRERGNRYKADTHKARFSLPSDGWAPFEDDREDGQAPVSLDFLSGPKVSGPRLEALIANSTPMLDLTHFDTMRRRARAVARIDDADGVQVGTGFLVSGATITDGLDAAPVLVTCHHVIGFDALAPELARVIFLDAQGKDLPKPFRIERIIWSASTPDSNEPLADNSLLDVCVCQMVSVPDDVEPMPIGVRPVGDAVVQIMGFPNRDRLAVTVSETRLEDSRGAFLLHTAPTLGGSSGSPLFDANWQVIGVHRAGWEAENLNIATAFDAVRDAIEIGPRSWIDVFYARVPSSDAPTARTHLESALASTGLADSGVEPVPFTPAQGYGFDIIPPEDATFTLQSGWETAHELMKALGGDALVEPLFREPVAASEPEGFLEGSSSGDTPLPDGFDPMWHHTIASVQAVHGAGDVGEGILIGHPDTGIVPHPEVKGRYTLKSGLNLVDGGEPIDPGTDGFAKQPFHGTKTGAVMVANPAHITADGFDMVGVAPGARLLPIRVTESVIITTWARRLAQAIDLAVGNSCQVISVSLGGVGSDRLRDSLRAARREGLIIAAASGNKVPWRRVVYPALYPEALAIAAVGPGGTPWSKSSRGSTISITAPGHLIVVPTQPDGSTTSSGTSYSTAFVAGAAALWLAKHADALDANGLTGRLRQGAFEWCLAQSATGNLPAGFGLGLLDCAGLLASRLPSVDEVNDFSPPASTSWLDALTDLVGGDDPLEGLGAGIGAWVKTRTNGLPDHLGREIVWWLARNPGQAQDLLRSGLEGLSGEIVKVSPSLSTWLSDRRGATPSGSPTMPSALAVLDLKRRVVALRRERDAHRAWASHDQSNAALLLNTVHLDRLATTIERHLETIDTALGGAMPDLWSAREALMRAEQQFGFKRRVEGQRLRPDDAMGAVLAQLVAAAGFTTFAQGTDPGGGRMAVEPLVYLAPFLSPATLAHGRDAPSLLVDPQVRRSLPFPVVVMPHGELNAPWRMPVLHHEVGHDLDADYRLRGPIRNSWRTNGLAQFGPWVGEALADCVGILLAGPAFGLALEAALTVTGLGTQHTSGSGHPPPYARLMLCAKWLELLGWGADPRGKQRISHLCTLAKALRMTTSDVAVWERQMEALARLTLETPQPGLNQESLSDRAPDARTDSDIITALVDALDDLAVRIPSNRWAMIDSERLNTLKPADAWRLLPSAIAEWVSAGPVSNDRLDLACFAAAALQDALPMTGALASPAVARFRREAIETLRPTKGRIDGQKRPSLPLFSTSDHIAFAGAANDNLPRLFGEAIAAGKQWDRIEIFYLSPAALKAHAEATGLRDSEALCATAERSIQAVLTHLRSGKIAKAWTVARHDHGIIFASWVDPTRPGGRIHVSPALWGIDIKHCESFDVVWAPSEATPTKRYAAYQHALVGLRALANIVESSPK